MSFNYLVELQKKNQAKQKKGFEIFFYNTNKDKNVVENPENPKEEEEKLTETEKPKPTEERYKKIIEEKPEKTEKHTRIKIIDKSATASIDREAILKLIKEKTIKKLSPVVEKEEEKEEEVQPLPKVVQQPDKKIKITIKRPNLKKEIGPKDDTEEQEPKVEKPKRGRPKIKIVTKLTRSEIVLDKKKLAERLPKHEKIKHRVSNYYMNNRKISIEKINQLFEPFRKELTENKELINCDAEAGSGDFKPLLHQKIILDYLNLYTPYRGLLLYYGLGAGKSCSSIVIAEGMKSDKKVFIMTPKSLKMNFFSELKKCGDPIFKKNQYWEFVGTAGHVDYTGLLSKALSLPEEYIEKNGGAWLVDVNKPSNYSELASAQQKSLDDQLNTMIRTKYIDLNYNGMRMPNLKELTNNFTMNPFDHSVIIIDEAHNFVSRIVNKIKKPKSFSYMLYDLLLKATDARIVLLTGTPIINYPNEIGILFNLLRGYIKTWTFFIDVKTSEKVNREHILNMFDKANFNTYDYVEYSGNKLTITRNPYGFINMKKQVRNRATKGGKGIRKTKKDSNSTGLRKTKKREDSEDSEESEDVVTQIEEYEEMRLDPETEQFRKDIYKTGDAMLVPGLDDSSYVYGGGASDSYNGVRLDSTGNLSDADFMKTVVKILKDNDIQVMDGATEIKLNKALPDNSDAFLNMFIDQDSALLKNKNLFQKRILGLVSYFRSAQEKLLPRFVESEPSKLADNTTYHIVESEMSPYQFEIYSKIRKEEREQEKASKKRTKKAQNQEDLYTISSTYRIFSRAACNYVFPQPPGRPMPESGEKEVISEAILDATPANQLQEVDSFADVDDEDEEEKVDKSAVATSYHERIQLALNYLQEHANECLTAGGLETYSPKFLNILENITDEENVGLHLVYSQFRTLEGVGILKLILEANGFEQLQIKKGSGDEWTMVEPQDISKPRFMLYTGTETDEEKEILRNIYNSQWEYVPMSIRRRLQEIADNNFMGEIVKIIMITSSGAEGINLKNTRFVHIVEPYWNLVRLEQVIGRARRICSHQDLPEELRTVKVFLYLATLSEKQRTSDDNKELIINDLSKLDKKTPITTDESLFEIARIKDNINQQLLTAIKETAVDCSLYSSNRKETFACYGYGKITSNDFSSIPDIEEDQHQKEELNVATQKLKGLVKIKMGKDEYAFDKKTNNVYDMESYKRAKSIPGENLILIGKIVEKNGKKMIEPV
jgi:hypothetical protein